MCTSRFTHQAGLAHNGRLDTAHAVFSDRTNKRVERRQNKPGTTRMSFAVCFPDHPPGVKRRSFDKHRRCTVILLSVNPQSIQVGKDCLNRQPTALALIIVLSQQ